MPANYLWNGEEVIVVEIRLGVFDVVNEHMNLMCVDTYEDEVSFRYGKYEPHQDIQFKCMWKPVPLEEFPTEFRTHLLLLGVT